MTWRWVIGGAVALVEEFAAADLDNVFIDAQGGRSIDTSGMAPWGWIVSGVERIQSLKATGASAPVWVIERGSNKRWADWFVDPVHTNHIGSHALARCVARATHLVHDRVWPTAATTTTSTLTPAPSAPGSVDDRGAATATAARWGHTARDLPTCSVI